MISGGKSPITPGTTSAVGGAVFDFSSVAVLAGSAMAGEGWHASAISPSSSTDSDREDFADWAAGNAPDSGSGASGCSPLTGGKLSIGGSGSSFRPLE